MDTDQIVPAQFLKRIERTGFGPFLFHEWRKDPSFVLNDERYAGAQILLAGAELRGRVEPRARAVGARGLRVPRGDRAELRRHLPEQLLQDRRCSPSSCEQESVRALMDAVLDDPTTRIAVDLETLTVTAPSVQEAFAFDDFRRWCLLEGYDDIDLTLRHTEEIAAFEAARPSWLPTA